MTCYFIIKLILKDEIKIWFRKEFEELSCFVCNLDTFILLEPKNVSGTKFKLNEKKSNSGFSINLSHSILNRFPHQRWRGIQGSEIFEIKVAPHSPLIWEKLSVSPSVSGANYESINNLSRFLILREENGRLICVKMSIKVSRKDIDPVRQAFSFPEIFLFFSKASQFFFRKRFSLR